MPLALESLTVDEWFNMTLNDYDTMTLNPTSEFDIREDIRLRRSSYPKTGGNPNRFIELMGGFDVLYSFYEPDPNTTRETHYYNTRLNALFLRIEVTDPTTGKKRSIWKMISQ